MQEDFWVFSEEYSSSPNFSNLSLLKNPHEDNFDLLSYLENHLKSLYCFRLRSECNYSLLEEVVKLHSLKALFLDRTDSVSKVWAVLEGERVEKYLFCDLALIIPVYSARRVDSN